MNDAIGKRRVALLRELTVPAVMLICAGFYWYDAFGLSVEAKAFPLALTAILALLLAGIVSQAIWTYVREPARFQASAHIEARDGAQRGMVHVKRWSIVALGAVLVFVWHSLGAAISFFLYSFALLFVLGERRPLRLVGIPAVLAVGLTYLFKTVLYLRLPDAAWLPGGLF